MRILLFYDCIYPGSVGGVEHRNHELAKALAARGHRVILAGFCDAPSEPFPGVEIRPVGPPGRLYTSDGRRSTAEALRLARAALRLDVKELDVLEAANIPYAHLPALAFRGRPLVVTWHEYWGRYWSRYLGAKWPVYAAVERVSAHLGTAAVAVSRLTAGRVQAVRGEAVRVVPNGIPVQAIQRAAGEGRAEGPPLASPLVYAGRLLREKRIDLLLEAVARLGRRGPLLAVYGDGPDRARLEGLARKDLVVFEGYLPTSVDVWRRMGAARIAVQPSSREGFGLFPLEAMAAGLPVVYCESSESALDELVGDGVHGLRTAPEPDALAAALDRLLNDEAERSRLAENARRHAEGFDWSAVAAEMEDVFSLAAR